MRRALITTSVIGALAGGLLACAGRGALDAETEACAFDASDHPGADAGSVDVGAGTDVAAKDTAAAPSPSSTGTSTSTPPPCKPPDPPTPGACDGYRDLANDVLENADGYPNCRLIVRLRYADRVVTNYRIVCEVLGAELYPMSGPTMAAATSAFQLLPEAQVVSPVGVGYFRASTPTANGYLAIVDLDLGRTLVSVPIGTLPVVFPSGYTTTDILYPRGWRDAPAPSTTCRPTSFPTGKAVYPPAAPPFDDGLATVVARAAWDTPIGWALMQHDVIVDYTHAVLRTPVLGPSFDEWIVISPVAYHEGD